MVKDKIFKIHVWRPKHKDWMSIITKDGDLIEFFITRGDVVRSDYEHLEMLACGSTIDPSEHELLTAFNLKFYTWMDGGGG